MGLLERNIEGCVTKLTDCTFLVQCIVGVYMDLIVLLIVEGLSAVSAHLHMTLLLHLQTSHAPVHNRWLFHRMLIFAVRTGIELRNTRGMFEFAPVMRRIDYGGMCSGSRSI